MAVTESNPREQGSDGPDRSDRDAQVAREQAKWDAEYASLPLLDESAAMKAFNAEFSRLVGELLPNGGSVLEAGCGAGWQSLALARTGKYKVHLLDFSREALAYARKLFAREGLDATFIEGDALAAGTPDFDMVYNAGVLEHYTFEQQVALLKGMKSRSRRYVLSMIPNRQCYWYWLWRFAATVEGHWTFGKEVPLSDLSPAFEAAGLHFVGQAAIAPEWTEAFISGLERIEPSLRQTLLEIHRTPIVPPAVKGYLVAALGSVGGKEGCVPEIWTPAAERDLRHEAEWTAMLCDALAMKVSAETELRTARERLHVLEPQVPELRQVKERLEARQAGLLAEAEALVRDRDTAQAIYKEVHEWAETLNKQLSGQVQRTFELEAELQAITASRAWKIARGFKTARRLVCPPGGLRERWARSCMSGLRATKAFLSRGPRAWLDAGAGSRRRERAGMRAAAGATRMLSPAVVASTAITAANHVPGLVSVILPVYNHSDMLAGAIESVLAQSYRDFELIVIDDGSKDDIDVVLRTYADHPKVRLLRQANQKLPKALTNAFSFARGEFWTWTSADNLMEPLQLERLVDFLRRRPDVALVYADYVAIDERGQPLRDPTFRPHNKSRPDSPEIHLPRDPKPLNTVDDNFVGACFLYRGWVGTTIGEYATELGCEDYDYWMRINALFGIAHLDSGELLYRYRVHENTLSANARELQISEKVRNLMKYEVGRHEFYTRPWTVLVDQVTGKWARAMTGAGHTVRDIAERADAGTVPESKTLVLISASTLESLADRQAMPGECVAVWLEGEPDLPYRLREQLASVDACFCPDEQTAARASLFNPVTFVAPPDQGLLDLATAFANNRIFYRSTTSAELRRRVLPEPLQIAQARRRILVQVERFAKGGLEQVVLDLIASLVRDGFDVLLLVTGPMHSGAEKARDLGAEIVTLATANREQYYRQLLHDRGIDLINAHFSLFGARIAAEMGIPFVQTIHSCYVFITPETAAAYRANDAYTTAYVCTSGNVAMYADLKLGLPPSKMIIGPNGIDPARLAVADKTEARRTLRRELGLADDDFVFLQVGAVYRDKAQKLVVSALSEVRKEHPKAKVVFLGNSMDDKYVEEVKLEITRRGLQGAVIMVDFRDGIAPFYAAADAFLLPSFWEGWSLSLGEALYAGLPVIATAVGSAPELVHRCGGHLLRPVFDSLLDLDISTLDGYLHGDHTRLIADITAAMKDVCARPGPVCVDDALRAALDARTAYGLYSRLFRWVIQGGSPEAARSWSRPVPSRG